MKTFGLRLATAADAESVLNIYAPYIEKTVITFEYEIPSVSDFQERMREILSAYPYMVCTVEDKIVGFAYASRHMARAAYQWNAVLSVYIDEHYIGYGMGSLLYAALMELLRLQNVQNVYGIITSPNEKSEAMHARLGFDLIGYFHKTGFKFGRWYDVSWWEKNIGTGEPELPDFKKIGEISEKEIRKILDRYVESFIL